VTWQFARAWVSIERLIDQLHRELEQPPAKPKLTYFGARIREPSMDRENRAKREARLTVLTAMHYREDE
jgi:hypothetical protein